MLTLTNATGLIVLPCLEFSDLFDNCYYNASVTGHGTDSYITTSYADWVSTVMTSPIMGTILPAAAMIIFVFSRWLVGVLLAGVDDT